MLYEGLDFAQTGLDEFATVLAFGQYIAGGQTPGGHWAGWEFAFRECPQRVFKIAISQLLVYCLQLPVKASGARDHTVQLKPIIVTWAQYTTWPAVPTQLNLDQQPAAGPKPHLATIYILHL